MRSQNHDQTLEVVEIFQSLAVSETYGTLRLAAGRRELLIYFGVDEISVASENERNQLANLVVKAELLTAREIADAQEQNPPGTELEEILLKEQLLSPGEIDAFHRARVLNEIHDVFSWPEPLADFHREFCPEIIERGGPEVTRLRGEMVKDVLSMMEVCDNWVHVGQAVPSVKEVFGPQDLSEQVLADIDMPPEVIDAAFLIDGVITLEKIAAKALLSEIEVLLLVYELLCLGAVEIVSLDDLRTRAHKFLADRDFRRAWDIYALLRLRLPDDVAMKWRYAESAALGGKTDAAIEGYEKLMEHYRKIGDQNRLIQVYERIELLAPGARPEISRALARLKELRAPQKAENRLHMYLALLIVSFLMVPLALFPRQIIAFLTPREPIKSKESMEEEAQKLLDGAIESEVAARYEESFRTKLVILRSYASTEAASKIQNQPEKFGLPLRLSSSPPGMVAYLSDRKVAELTELFSTIRFAPRATLSLRVRNGSEDVFKELLDATVYHEIVIDLRSRASWTVDAGAPITVPPAVIDGSVFAWCRDGFLRVIGLGGLRLDVTKLRVGLYGHRWTPPIVWNGAIYAGNSRGILVSYDPLTQEISQSAIDGFALTIPPISLGSSLLLGTQRGKSGQLYRFDPRLGIRPKKIGGIENFGRCRVRLNRLFGCRPDGVVFCYAIGEEKVVWTNDLDIELAGDVLIGEQLYLLSRQGTLYALDLTTGDTRETYDFVRHFTAGPLWLENDLLLASTDGSLIRVAPDTLGVVWESRRDPPNEWRFDVKPLVSENRILSAQPDGRFVVIDGATGNEAFAGVWSETPPAFIRCTTPALLRQQGAVFGTSTGKIIAIDLGDVP